MRHLFIIPLLWAFHTNADSCSTSQGVNLAKKGPYQAVGPRSQGSVGTCYVHSASDLLTTFLNSSTRFNVYEAALATDSEMNGGQPVNVMNSLIKRGFACADTGDFKNLFPSQTQNIITELQDVVAKRGVPTFYSNNIYVDKKSEDRQLRIALLAGRMADNPKLACGPVRDAEVGVNEFLKLNEEIKEIESKISELKNEKDLFDGWFNTRSTLAINTDILTWTKLKTVKSKKAADAHYRYRRSTEMLHQGSGYLDEYNESDAAEVVYHWAKTTHAGVEAIFKKYGVSDWTPTMSQYIVEKVQKDPIAGYTYSGGMYPYRLLKRLMMNACKTNNFPIPKNLVAKSLQKDKAGVDVISHKIESLLEKLHPQGVGVTLKVRALQTADDTSLHAVNIIGCRTVNKKREYLIHNSWGQGCQSYHPRLQSQCENGRVWLSGESLMLNATDIQWIEKK